MKILSYIKFITLLSLIMLSLISSKNHEEKQDYTGSDQTGKDLKSTKLSQALQETDPKMSLQRTDFMRLVKYVSYKLTRGELEQIFVFADLNRDDLIDHYEWDKFNKFYILPFEKCDKEGKYVLNKEEFKECWTNDPKSSLIQFKKKHGDNAHELIMSIVSSRKSKDINFSDYLLIRRSMFGWQQCQSSSKYIAKSHFRCAFKLAIPQKYNLKISLDRIYEMGLQLANDPGIRMMDYIPYLQILYSSYVFVIFGLPHNIPFLNKEQFIKSLREDRYPNFFEENEVNVFYDLISANPVHIATEMNFETWCFYLLFNRLFQKYSKERPLFLTREELISLLDDPLVPVGLINSIDISEHKYDENVYREASLMLQRKKIDESEFYFSFKEKQPEWFLSKSNVVSDFLPIPNYHIPSAKINKNEKSRELFFKIMADVQKNVWNKYTYYRSFQLTNLFLQLTNDQRYIVTVSTAINMLPRYYDIVNPPISNIQRKNLSFYKNVPTESFLDLLTFLTIENYQFKIRSFKISGSKVITETLLKVLMKEFNMDQVPDNIIDFAKTGYDKLRRRMYDLSLVIKNLIIVQTVAAELIRTNRMRKDYEIKENKSRSRLYPIPNRRLKGSKLV